MMQGVTDIVHERAQRSDIITREYFTLEFGTSQDRIIHLHSRRPVVRRRDHMARKSECIPL